MDEIQYIPRGERERMAEEYFKVNNSEDIEWITVKGNHIPIKKGQSKKEAIREFIKDKKEPITGLTESEWGDKAFSDYDKWLKDNNKKDNNRNFIEFAKIYEQKHGKKI